MKLPLLRDSTQKSEIRSKPKSAQPPNTHPLKPLLCQAFVCVVILSQIFLVVFLTRARSASTRPNFSNSDPQECPSGSVYVYDLPAMFNNDLLTNCDKLDPQTSKCDAVSNNGYGPRAMTELSRVVPKKLAPAWYWTDHYMVEIIYHNRLLDYKCRTMEPESATSFYIPFYVGLAVGKHVSRNHTARDWDLLYGRMLKWVQGQKWWKRSNGSDHFITMGRLTWDFRRPTDSDSEGGSRFIHMPGMENVLRLTVEKSLSDRMEIAVPYPTEFHPRTVSDVREWQRFVRSRTRTGLFTFVGATRGTVKNDFTGVLLSQCRNESGSCQHVDCSETRCVDGTASILETFLGSVFCLQTKGDGFTRRSLFDCMLAGSIPVFFRKETAYKQNEKGWFLPADPERYSVFIDQNEVRNGISVRKILEGYHIEEVWRMRERVVENIPKFLYGIPSDGLSSMGFRDAFDIAIDGVLRKFKDHKYTGRKDY
ncbi:xyloglucan galactosyltransferase XLT2-like [Rhododendron vialii]|uniref:xyloglucan galactosyltransferase XLT2-like n=1 Tax=Rhododendron vialii TaxID=182163 RepID=UPI00265E55C3|nr:xyloglucan galactosyltransferase XLT2-like [Rhododendron vialii]